MKSLIVLLFVISFSATNLLAKKEKRYPVNDISEDLLKNAISVVRIDQKFYEVINEGKFNLKRKCAITILNSRAESQASFAIMHDEFRKIKNLEARIYNANGEIIDKVKTTDILDINVAAGQAASLNDARIKVYEAVNSAFPYTFEYEYEMESEATLFYPIWQPVKSYYQGIENDVLSIQIPKGINFDYKELHLLTPVETSEEDDIRTYSWTLENFSPLKPESHSPLLSEFTPLVYTRAKNFTMDGYEGSLESWSDLGKWIEQLNKGRCVIPDESKAELVNLVNGAESLEEKVNILYKHLQSKTRYVSIQMGIGGWQTAPANEVDKNGYGDCKALSNYMKAMLDAVGIESKYTLINAGSSAREIEPDFPRSQFNHAILMVPNQGDTIWLECTSQRNPFGYQGTFTGNRQALVVDGENSCLVSTTNYTHENNRKNNTGEFTIFADGSAQISTTSKYCGLRYDNLRSMYFEGEEEQLKFLRKRLDYNEFEINDYSVERKEGKYPEAKLDLDLHIKKYASTMGDRLFIPVNSFNQSTYVPDRARNRKTDVVKKNAYTETDEYQFTLPDGFNIEALPDKLSIAGKFGSYKSSVTAENNQIIYKRELIVYRGKFPKETYQDMIDFYKYVAKGDKIKIVLIQE